MNLIQQLDESILFYILNHLHTPILDKIMIELTSLGNSGFIWIAIAFLLLLYKKTRPCGILLVTALSIEYILGDGILKHLIARNRPFIRFPDVPLLIKKPGSYSFPSGHTMSSFTAATVIFYFNKYAGIPAYLLAGLIGFSRLYLFCHYPLDVLSGAVFGIATALMVFGAARTIRLKARENYQS
ncbi:MAG: phosphatase PAP2 family protein [Anaerocolumna sp.]